MPAQAHFDHRNLPEERVGSAAGVYFATEISFFLALAALALAKDAPAPLAERAAAAQLRAEKQLQAAAQTSTANFRHRLLLLEAERASHTDDRSTAGELFDQALDAANTNGFVRDAALVGEVAAKWYLRLGRNKLARYYMAEAQAGYLRWGTIAKAEQLLRCYPLLFPQIMPLIGTVDSQRAEQVLNTALEGAQRQRASVVILDITGVTTVDAGVAGTLLNTARALRLLGTQTVLTGIRAEVAQMVVRLGIELGDVVSRSTLQSGIVYALTLSGESGRLSAKTR